MSKGILVKLDEIGIVISSKKNKHHAREEFRAKKVLQKKRAEPRPVHFVLPSHC